MFVFWLPRSLFSEMNPNFVRAVLTALLSFVQADCSGFPSLSAVRACSASTEQNSSACLSGGRFLKVSLLASRAFHAGLADKLFLTFVRKVLSPALSKTVRNP